MGILSKTFAAIISSGSIYALYFQYWYNYNRRILLGNQQSMLYASTDIHVITCLTPKDGYDLKIILINLNQKMRQNHGKAIYCGKILRGDNSKQPGMSQEMQDSFQVVLVSQWPSRESFVAFRDQHLRGPICEFKYAWSTPFKRDQWANLSLPMFLGSLYVGNIVNGRTYPVDENNASDETFINSMEKKKVKNFEQLNDMTTLLIGNTIEEQQEPVFIWNWILPGNNKQRQASNEYRDNMMRMLAENGGTYIYSLSYNIYILYIILQMIFFLTFSYNDIYGTRFDNNYT